MARKQTSEPIVEVCDLIKKDLILNLFKLDVSQGEIAKKLHIDVHTVNEFLKGIKKNGQEN